MPRSYRRRTSRYRRYRPTYRRRSRIGRRRIPRTGFRNRRRYLHPRTISARYPRAITTYDRTPNFAGDATLAQMRDMREFTLLRDTVDDQYYIDALVPGSHLSSDDIPTFKEYKEQYHAFKVVKATLVAEFVNMGDLLKNVGIIVLPTGVSDSGVPSWTPSQCPMDQPRCSWTTLGPKTSSKSVRKLVAVGTPLIASGDTVNITSGGTECETTDATVEPNAPWYFLLWQGNNTAVTADETADDGIRVRVTVYYVIKFYNRRLELE